MRLNNAREELLPEQLPAIIRTRMDRVEPIALGIKGRLDVEGFLTDRPPEPDLLEFGSFGLFCGAMKPLAERPQPSAQLSLHFVLNREGSKEEELGWLNIQRRQPLGPGK